MSMLNDLIVAIEWFHNDGQIGNFWSAKGHYSLLAILFYYGNREQTCPAVVKITDTNKIRKTVRSFRCMTDMGPTAGGMAELNKIKSN